MFRTVFKLIAVFVGGAVLCVAPLVACGGGATLVVKSEVNRAEAQAAAQHTLNEATATVVDQIVSSDEAAWKTQEKHLVTYVSNVLAATVYQDATPVATDETKWKSLIVRLSSVAKGSDTPVELLRVSTFTDWASWSDITAARAANV